MEHIATMGLRHTKIITFPVLFCLGFFMSAGIAFGQVPRGVFCLGNTGRAINDTALNNPDIIGASIRYGWMDLEATEGAFDWTYLDLYGCRSRG